MTPDRGRALAAVLLDIGEDTDGASWERRVPERLSAFASSLPPGVRAGLGAADLALDGLSLLTTARRAHRLPPEAGRGSCGGWSACPAARRCSTA